MDAAVPHSGGNPECSVGSPKFPIVWALLVAETVIVITRKEEF
jgi:hypothetical protein